MNEEIKKMFEELRAELAKSAGAVARINMIEKDLADGHTLLKGALDEVKKLREENDAVTRALETVKRDARVTGIARDGIHTKEQGLRILGIQARALLAAALGVPVPTQFVREAEELKAFRERTTLSPGATTGSYLVPTIVGSDVLDTLEQLSGMARICDFRVGLPGPMDLPTLTGRPALQHARATIDTDPSASSPTFGQLQFRPDEGYVFFPVSNALLEMAAVQLGAYVLALLPEAIMDGIGYDALRADGTSTYNSQTGLLKEATAGYVYALPSNKTAFADVTAKDLWAAKSKLLLRAQNVGQFLCGTYIEGVIGDLDRTGKVPIIRDGPNGTRTVNGHTLVVDPYMPAEAESAAATAFAILGDFKTMFIGIVNGINIATSTEYLFGRNQTCFRGTVSFQCKRKAFAGLITMKTASGT